MILTYSLLAAVAVLMGRTNTNAFVFQIPSAHWSISSSTKLFADTINSNNHKQEGELKIEELVDEAVYSATSSVAAAVSSVASTGGAESAGVLDNSATELIINDYDEPDEQTLMDRKHMNLAIQTARANTSTSPFPKPPGGAVIALPDGRILGTGRSDHVQNAVCHAITAAGLAIVPLSEWVVSWPASPQLRKDLKEATLYVTLEPSHDRQGTPSLTQLIAQCGLTRVVIGCADPIPEKATEGAAALHKAGLEVILGFEEEECQELIEEYATLANSKLQRSARQHFARSGQPLGFLHCSVVNSDNVEAFARQGNAFGKDFGGKTLSFRDFGSYAIAPPPEAVWADDIFSMDDDFETELVDADIFSMDFEEEEEAQSIGKNPMMPWYEQVDAIVATFPKQGNGPSDDSSVMARLNGLKWLATRGNSLPANVERILVMDATDLHDLPITNDDPNLPLGVNVEEFWAAKNRRPTRVLLRKGENAQAQAAARAAARAAQAAAEAAQAALEAMESGQAAEAAEAAVKFQDSAAASAAFVQSELAKAQALKTQLSDLGVIVETLNGGQPIDVMRHLGKRNGYQSVVWRAGCWGERGVKAILDGAFQYVSAHLAVDAGGGRFWQLMLAERAVQAACGAERKVKIYADQEDISLEYCDEVDADTDCVLTVDGQPVRHVRLDCRVALVDENRERQFAPLKTMPMTQKKVEEAAPWFL